MNLKEGMDHAASPSLPSNGRSALPQRIEFHLAKKSMSSFADSKNFKVQSSSATTTISRAFMTSSENVLESDIRFHMAVRRIGAGLENLGNTCFLNSVLQCLTYTEPLVAYLQSGKHQNSCHVVGFCALCAIQKHVVRALQSTGRILAPKDLVSNLRRISRNFRNARQEDAHEYMVNLLESMHKCCLPSGVPSESSSAYEKSLVHRIFGGCLRSQVKCMQCSYCSDKFDPFLDLSLEIMKADSVYKALGHFTAREQLDGGERQYQCQRCKQKVRAVKQLTIHKAPFVLTIHLKRFGSHISGQKIDKRVQFASTLNLKPFVSGSYEGDLKYTLYGVLVHAGWSTHSGHYFCFVRTSTGMWYSLDDNRVYQVSEKTVLEQKAYMLFYVRDAVNNAPSKTSNTGQKEKPVANIGLNGASSTSPATSKVFENSSGKPINPITEEKGVTAGLQNGVSGPSTTQIISNRICEDKGVRIHEDFSSIKLVRADGSGALDRSNRQISVLSSDKTTPKDISGLGNSNTLTLISVDGDKESVPLHSNLHVGSSEKTGDPSASVKILASSNGIAAGKCTKVDPLVSVAKVSDNLSDVASGMLSISQKAGSSSVVPLKTDFTRTTSSSNGPVVNASKTSSGQNAKRKGPKHKVLTLHLGKRILYGGLLNVHKRKPKKVGNKGKKIVAKPLVDQDTGPSTSHASSASTKERSKNSQEKRSRSPLRKQSPDAAKSDVPINGSSSVKDFDDEFLKRVSLGNSAENGGDKPLKSTENHAAVAAALTHWENEESTCQKLNVGINPGQNGIADNPARLFETVVGQWDNVESKNSRVKNTLTGKSGNIGYVPDEWDEEYDRGKRKKLRLSKVDFDGPNPFQEIASKKASKSMKPKRERYNLANQPFRI